MARGLNLKMNRVFIIAEAGVNHNGSIKLGCELIDIAKDAGADAVKFQSFLAKYLVSKKADKAEYQKRLTKKTESHYEMIKRLELSLKDHKILIEHAKKRKIKFLSSPFDEESANLLKKLKIDMLKIPSGEVTNHPFLTHCANLGLPIILSTGMCTLSEVAEAVEVLKPSKSLSLLHCVTEYPTPYREVNLRAMDTLSSAFSLPVGYSDHTLGIEIALAAVARGARIIEKHFTLDRTLPGPDHQASLEPNELKEMVRCIRNIEDSLGTGVKQPAACELKNIPIARKSLVADMPIKKGTRLSRENVKCKRPGTGISPKDLDKVIGMRVNRDLDRDETIYWKDLKL
jgi:N-acetylneuraminate synthase